MTEDAFDKQINDAFHGAGKQRTMLSGMFLVLVDKLFNEYGYRAVTAWQDDDTIVVCVEKPDTGGGFWQSMMGIGAETVRADIQAAVREFVQDYIDYDQHGWDIPWFKDEHFDRWVSLCETHYPDTAAFFKNEYGKYWQGAAVEMGFWHEFGSIEPHFKYIQSIERVNGSLVIVHKAQRKRWQLGDPPVSSDELLPVPGKTRLQ